MTALIEVGEEGLRKMLEVSTDFTERRQIRAALRELQFGCIPGLLASHSSGNNKKYSFGRIELKMAGTAKGAELDRKLSQITDEDEMTKLLHATEDYEDRRKIRTALRDLKKKKIADQEAASAAARKNRMAEPKKVELNLEGIKDEAVLRQMLEETEDVEHKKQIRTAIKDLRQKARDAAEEVIAKEEEDYRKKMIIHADEDHIPALSVEPVIPTEQVVDFTTIDDISTLERMLANTEDFGERSQIRAHIKELREREELEVPDYPGARRLSEGLDADIWLTEKDRRRSSLIDRAALEELTLTPDVVENVAYDEIEDPAELEKLLENAVDIGEKRLIRAALNDLKKRLAGGNKDKKASESAQTSTTDVSFYKPEVRISPSDEEPKKTCLEAKGTLKVNDQSKKSDSSSDKTKSFQTKERLETSQKVDSNKTSERLYRADALEMKSEATLSKKSETERENKENESVPQSSMTSWVSGVYQKPEIRPSKSSTTAQHRPKEKNNNGISIKPASKLSVSADPGKTKRHTSYLSIPSKNDSTQKENEKNNKESALAARMSKFTTITDSTKAKTGDQSTSSTPSTSRLDKNGKEAKDASLLSLRLSKSSTPTSDTHKGKLFGSRTPSGSKLDSLKSKFSGTETPSQQEFKVKDRALRGTEGKVSEAASKFGGSCSGSSCATTPSHSPAGSAPSSPKRYVGTKALATSPVAQKPFEFGKIHNPALAPTPRSSKSTEKSSIKLQASQSVPSSKVATSKFETPTSSTSNTSVSTPHRSKDSKSTKVEVPLGKLFSLELHKSGDKTITVEASLGTSHCTETPSADQVGLRSVLDKTNQPRRKSPTERREEAKLKMPPVDDIEDEEALEKMLEAASEFEERKKIRAKLREIRKKKREEMDKQISAQQKSLQDDILSYREESKAHRLKAFDKTVPIKKDTTTTVEKTPLNNNTIIVAPKTSSTTIEDKEGKSSTTKTTTVIEGPGSKTVTTTMHSKSEDKGTKSESMNQQTMSVKKEESGSGSSFSVKSSSISSSVSTSSSTGTPAAKKLTKFEAEMEEKKRQRELKRAEDEKNWKEYMAKKKQDDFDRKKREMEAAKKKKEALMNKFGGKADAESGGFGKGTGMQAVPNASTIKQKLLEWCQRCARGYPEVQINNFSSSWADGMAFCAIVHYHFPNAFDFDTLDKKNRRKNFDLAFESAEKHGDVMPLLETDDMIMMKNKPDWKCVFTYVQSLYRHLSKIKQP
ncbi:smoothelin-like isoform X2 [Acanthaster planci]|uniref:Smoothelin-like isoform X2 n=1 Tax=Acanthaster planci TaxID=133434 RepID=A0A8B7ZTB5_ACAPL|nr:smoothelin-like isoform X2 [Acanthaster planci]